MGTVKAVGEFGLIDRLARLLPAAPSVVEGIGDDCAVVRTAGGLLLLSCDLAIENVHFKRCHAPGESIGWKAAASAWSDIAAMGGRPLVGLVSLACTPDTPADFVEEIFQGLVNASSHCGGAIVGGDTTRSCEGIVLDVTVLGEPGAGGRYLTRKGAHSGDRLAVTGYPGRAAAGLHALEHGNEAPALIEALYRPLPRMMEGQWLCAQEIVHAAIDVSDGVAQDAGHLAERSGLGLNVDPERLLVHPALKEYCVTHGLDAHAPALAGGEDFELALALSPEGAETFCEAFEREHNLPLTVIGEFTKAWDGLRIAGEIPKRTGFDHFA